MLNTKALEELINELRLGLHQVTQFAEELHGDEPISIGMRGVLEYLLRNSDAAVPAIARGRYVSRQLIQTLVNALLEQDLVALVENPAHRRSALVSLTPAGKDMIGRMRRREEKAFHAMQSSLSEVRLKAATRTLRTLRAELTGDNR
jgi:DNA-binding MarR family transcriptional regulator